MYDVSVAIIFIYLCFLLVGIGPTLLIFESSLTWDGFLGLAPAIGLSLITIIGTYLVLLDYPVDSWSFSILIIGFLLSLYLSYKFIKKKNYINRQDKKYFLIFLIGLVIVAILLLMPILLGGLSYTVLRGNGTDTFNYMTMAGYLLHEPYSTIFHSTIDTLIDKNASYPLAQALLKTRWSTSMLLAWSSSITNVPLYRFEFGFTILFFIIDYGVSYLIARQLRLSPIYSILVAISICTGFWGQFVLDIRAMSEISVFPLLLLFVYGLSDCEIKVTKTNRRQILLGLVFTAIIFLYVEILPTCLLGTAIFIGVQFFYKRYTLQKLFKYWTALFVSLLTALPAAKYLTNFFTGQASYALYAKNNWHDAYFYWLYNRKLEGFWGVNYADQFIASSSFHLFFMPIGIILSICLLLNLAVAIFLNKGRQDDPFLIISSFFFATVVLFIYLIVHSQLWAAGKVLSFGYPFIIFTLAGGLVPLQSYLEFKYSHILLNIGWFVISLWLLIQCLEGGLRIRDLAQGINYPIPISGHGLYRQYDWNIERLKVGLKYNHCHQLGLKISDVWLAEYFNFVFGWDIKTILLKGVLDRAGELIGQQKILVYPDCILIPRSLPFNQNLYQIISQSNEFILLKFHSDINQ